jgi:hypothetical protein
MIESKSLRVSTPWGQPQKPRTDWPTADDVPDDELKWSLCSEGAITGGSACVRCESQCAYGRKWVKLYDPKPLPVSKAETDYVPEKYLRVYKDGQPQGNWDNVKQVAAELGVSAHYVYKSMRDNEPFHGYSFAWVWI